MLGYVNMLCFTGLSVGAWQETLHLYGEDVDWNGAILCNLLNGSLHHAVDSDL